MPEITNPTTIVGGGLEDPYVVAGAPSAGTDEVWTLTIGGAPTNGDLFRLAAGGHPTADIAWNSTNATLVANVDAALEALGIVGASNVVTAVGTMTAGVGTITLTFSGGTLAKLALPASFLSVDNNALTGAGTVAVAQTTPGVNATARGAPKGAKLLDITNGFDYINTGTANAPTWTKTGTQT